MILTVLAALVGAAATLALAWFAAWVWFVKNWPLPFNPKEIR